MQVFDKITLSFQWTKIALNINVANQYYLPNLFNNNNQTFYYC